MRRRIHFACAAMGVFASTAISSTPAAASPCTNLQSVQLRDTTIAANFACITDDNDFNQMPAPKFGP